MSIIEKLGITPGPWEKDYNGTEHHIKSLGYKGNGTPTVCKYNDDFKHGGRIMVADNLTEEEKQANGNLIASAPELLETLIEELKFIEKFLDEKASAIGPHWYSEFYERQIDIKSKIIKACHPKKWDEINELLE